jgi:hypothetical protein
MLLEPYPAQARSRYLSLAAALLCMGNH